MSYVDRFRATDDLIAHLQTVIPMITDEKLKSEYAGFLSANAVTAYELAIKDIFIAFAEKKHHVFGTYVENKFSRISGHINIEEIKKYVKSFGEKYSEKFDKKINKKIIELLGIYRNDIRSTYGNLITCRNEYIHANRQTMSFEEVVTSYQLGKELINVLSETMQR
jgi:hypothetical protein